MIRVFNESIYSGEYAKYFPNKYLKYIDDIDMTSDFDNKRNRTVWGYTVWFTNGERIYAVGVPQLKIKVKEYIEQNLEQK